MGNAALTRAYRPPRPPVHTPLTSLRSFAPLSRAKGACSPLSFHERGRGAERTQGYAGVGRGNAALTRARRPPHPPVHTPLTSLRSFAPLSLCERGLQSPFVPRKGTRSGANAGVCGCVTGNAALTRARRPPRPPVHTPLTSLRSFAPLSLCERGLVAASVPFRGTKGDAERSERRGMLGWDGECRADPRAAFPASPRAYPAHVASLVRAPFAVRKGLAVPFRSTKGDAERSERRGMLGWDGALPIRPLHPNPYSYRISFKSGARMYCALLCTLV